MEKRDVWMLAGVVVVLAIVVVLFTQTGPRTPGATSTQSAQPAAPGAAQGPTTPTRAPAPANVVVPNKGSTNVPSNVAVPQVEAAASPTSNAHYKSFNITAANGQFSPGTIEVNVGDTVNLEITASGQNYDFTQPDYGIKSQIPEGTTKQIQFSATASGQFLFYCASCGGPKQGPTGHLIVAK